MSKQTPKATTEPKTRSQQRRLKIQTDEKQPSAVSKAVADILAGKRNPKPQSQQRRLKIQTDTTQSPAPDFREDAPIAYEDLPLEARQGMMEVPEWWYTNRYLCPQCRTQWDDCWPSTCDDVGVGNCPQCGKRRVSPFSSTARRVLPPVDTGEAKTATAAPEAEAAAEAKPDAAEPEVVEISNHHRALYIDRAREDYVYPSDDKIAIDDDAKVSAGDEGAWVQAWVYVTDEEAGVFDEYLLTYEHKGCPAKWREVMAAEDEESHCPLCNAMCKPVRCEPMPPL